jgi:phospholipid/cholesterol/gamma-HCH transport system substrate-binding protein
MSQRIDSLVSDFQAKPYRYMPLKSKRKVEKYDKQEGAN